ncbi:MAG: iron-containing redox enzyme family protein [Nitrososphaerales archaeon]
MLTYLLDEEISKRSLLKHPFYQSWREGKLTLEALRGYAKEYFQLVKTIPRIVERIIEFSPLSKEKMLLHLKEEKEHIELWLRFAEALGISRKELLNYDGLDEIKETLNRLYHLSLNFYDATALMYSLEAELPKISKIKADSLERFYGMKEKEIKYFRIHEVVDIRHAELWRRILNNSPLKERDLLLKVCKNSLKAQNQILDVIMKTYMR